MPSKRSQRSSTITSPKSIILTRCKKVQATKVNNPISIYLLRVRLVYSICVLSEHQLSKASKALQGAVIEEDKRDLINREIGKFRKTAQV